MNLEFNPHDESKPQLPADAGFAEIVMRYQDGTLSPDELSDLNAELLANPDRLQEFAQLQKLSAAVHDVLRQQVFEESRFLQASHANSRVNSSRRIWELTPVLAVVLIFVVGLWSMTRPLNEVAQKAPAPADDHLAPADDSVDVSVKLAGFSHAKFFGELVPEIQSVLASQRPYVLTGGMLELDFPTGASAIIEAPAVFRILSDESLAMDTGRCSVHAPDGAEGFRVETPVSRVVDRGTRFSVNVSETRETEVHVVEGIADVYQKAESSSLPVYSEETSQEQIQSEEKLPLQSRLKVRDAQRFAGSAEAVPVTFTPSAYRSRLPDRIVKYAAAKASDGRVEHLENVTVQRGGVLHQYTVEDLIPVELIWFKSYPGADRSGHLSGAASLPQQRRDWLSDTSLITGVINPGGQQEPLQTDPVMQIPEDPENPNTPGFAIRFQHPVVNGPGPDVVFFELQTLTNSPDGDAIHVSPMKFESSRRSMTIRVYDLGLTSPEALPLTEFYLYRFSDSVNSLEELEGDECTRTQSRLNFRALAVGIDLSEMGFEEGEAVSELFIQDANDDDAYVDPVFIAGLPGSFETFDAKLLSQQCD